MMGSSQVAIAAPFWVNSGTWAQSQNLPGLPVVGHRVDDFQPTGRAPFELLGNRVTEERVAMVALSLIPKLSSFHAKELVLSFGSALHAFNELAAGRAKDKFLPRKVYERLASGSILQEAMSLLRKAEAMGQEVLVWNSNQYPVTLQEASDSPLILFAQGNLEALSKPCIAVVGTRSPSEEGLRAAHYFAHRMSVSGFNIVSGLAHGIDAAAHTGALLSEGLTTAVLGHGLDQIYPSVHRGLAKSILDQGGLLLSEFQPGVKPDSHHFPSRNRIIAGLCHGTLVVQAKDKGGALITAKQAFEQNRLVFAIPGGLSNAHATGCNMLIRDNIAKLVMRPEDVIEEVLPQLQIPKCRLTGHASSINTNDKKAEHPLSSFLTNAPVPVEELAMKVPSELDLPSALLELELAGMIERTSDGVKLI